PASVAEKSPRMLRPPGARMIIPASRAGAAASTAASAPMASSRRDAPGLRYSAHALSRGKWARSRTSTSAPALASCQATAAPAGPPPTTTTRPPLTAGRSWNESPVEDPVQKEKRSLDVPAELVGEAENHLRRRGEADRQRARAGDVPSGRRPTARRHQFVGDAGGEVVGDQPTLRGAVGGEGPGGLHAEHVSQRIGGQRTTEPASDDRRVLLG